VKDNGKYCNEELQNFNYALNTIRVIGLKVGEICSAHGKHENCTQNNGTVQLQLSGLIGIASPPDTQKIRITGFFF
jgi:hypothetical protein